MMMMRHLQRKKVRAKSQVVTTILQCVQALRAQQDAGPASGPLGPLTKPRDPFECPLAQRVNTGGKTHVYQPSEGKSKNRAFDDLVSWFDWGCLAAHVLQ